MGKAGDGTPVAFALAGVVALLTTYSYAKLSAAYPSRGGTVTFLDRVFGGVACLIALAALKRALRLHQYADRPARSGVHRRRSQP